jgi:hypothetical protein
MLIEKLKDGYTPTNVYLGFSEKGFIRENRAFCLSGSLNEDGIFDFYKYVEELIKNYENHNYEKLKKIKCYKIWRSF